MNKINTEIIESIRDNSSISQVISNYIPLVKKGRSFAAVCPFHDDHDPSLSISEEKQIYKCFVCGEGGNVFSFVKKYKSCSFLEAVVEVAKISGQSLDIDVKTKKNYQSKNQKYYDILNETINHTNYLLYTDIGSEAKKYLENRGIDDELIKYFKIGYNDAKNSTYNFLKSLNYQDSDLIDVNVCRDSEYGIKDVFYNRVLFPIFDENNNPLGFSARSLDGNGAKYINTSETIIYTKGNVLYNLNNCKEEVKKKNRIYLVEGVIDVLAFKKAGINNAISTLGTSLTKKQLEILKHYTDNIVIVYDGDKAGKDATIKAGIMALENNFNVFTILNNTNKDPDEIVNEYGKNALRDLITKEISLIEFGFDYYDNGLRTYNDRKIFSQNIGSLIDLLSDEVDRVNYNLLLQEKSKIQRNSAINKTKIKQNNFQIENDYSGIIKAEYIVISQMMLDNRAIEEFINNLGYLTDINNNKIANILIENKYKNKKISYSCLIDELEDEQLIKIISGIGNNEIFPKEYHYEILQDAINSIKRSVIIERRDFIIKAINSELDSDKKKELLLKLSEINLQLGGKNEKRKGN